MDWDLVIKRNLGVLLHLLGEMFGRVRGDVPRAVHLGLLRRMRAVEAGVRRLIVLAARGLVVTRRARALPDFQGFGPGSGAMRGFALFDPRKDFELGRKVVRDGPRITVIGVDDWQARAASSVQPLNPERLQGRLSALKAALDDLPKQARRLARLKATRARRLAAGKGIGPLSPMRPGWPPGYRVDRHEPVHRLLIELDTLARRVENAGVGV